MPKIGRNEPCPCESGKKYKKCCLDKDAEEAKKKFEELEHLKILDESTLYDDAEDQEVTEEEASTDLFKEDFIHCINMTKVCSGFEQFSLDDLKKNPIFYRLFNDLGNEIDLQNEIDLTGEEFITLYTRDIFLLTRWYENIQKEQQPNFLLGKLATFYCDLQRYRGEILTSLNSEAIREVFEVWIIKNNMTPEDIDNYATLLENFYTFLEQRLALSYERLDSEEIIDLKRVALEFRQGIWEKKGQDYISWRMKNILHYM